MRAKEKIDIKQLDDHQWQKENWTINFNEE
jgi:hypothetical protein